MSNYTLSPASIFFSHAQGASPHLYLQYSHWISLPQLAKKLLAKQWKKLKEVVDSESRKQKKVTDLETFLLTAPTFTKEQLAQIDKTRKAINQWRTK